MMNNPVSRNAIIAVVVGVALMSCSHSPNPAPPIIWPTADIVSLDPVPNAPGFLYIAHDDFKTLYNKWKREEGERKRLAKRCEALEALLVQYGIEIPAE